MHLLCSPPYLYMRRLTLFSEGHPHMWNELQRSERVTQRLGQKHVIFVLICLLAIQSC